MMAYNLMRLFKQAVMRPSHAKSRDQTVHQTLKTLRYKLFAKAGCLATQCRARILKRAIALQHREGLWDSARTFDLPVHFSVRFSPANTSQWKIWV